MRVFQRLKRTLPGLALTFAATLIALLGLELAVRLVLPQQLILLRPDVWQPHDGLGWRHTPHLDVDINTGERTIRLRTDANGFRVASESQPPNMSGTNASAESARPTNMSGTHASTVGTNMSGTNATRRSEATGPPTATSQRETSENMSGTDASGTSASTVGTNMSGTRRDPRHRVLALGDSFIEAIQVEAEDTVTERLASSLAATLGDSVEVVNTGVGGWGPNQYRLQARAELGRQRYDAVVVFLFLGNDIVSWTTDHVAPRQPAQKRRLRIPRRLDKGELIDAFAYPVNNTLEARSHLFTLVKARLKFLLMRLGLSQHALPTSLRTAFRDGDHWRITAGIVADIQALADAHGLPTLAVLLPGVYQVERGIAERYADALDLPPSAIDIDQPATLLGTALREEGIDVLDATVALRAASSTGEAALYGRVDTHLSPEGHRVVADAVTTRLAARLLEADPAPRDEPMVDAP